MFSFVVENKDRGDKAVTTTYMEILKDACVAVCDNIEYVTKGQKPSDKRSCVVSDTVQTAITYLVKGYKNQIVWMQGILPEESYMRNHSRIRFAVLSILEKIVLKKAKMLLLVSEEMKTHYEKKYHLKLSNKSVIMPCFNECGPTEGAFSADKYSENTFVYVGSLHKWQCFEETVRFYSDIEKAASGATKLFVYTFQKETAEEIIAKYDVKNYEVDCAAPDELSERIKSIKYGFVLREDNPVNNVATPTKLSNYISNGIIPVYSSAVRSFADYDSGAKIGVVCDLNDIESGLNNILAHMGREVSAEEMKKKCEAVFAEYYCRERYIDELSKKIKTIV